MNTARFVVLRYMERIVGAGGCPVIIAQWPEHWHLKSRALGSIPGNYRSFRFPLFYFETTDLCVQHTSVWPFLRPAVMAFLFNYLYSSFVPSVISLWNSLPDSIKTSLYLRLMYHIITAIYVAFVCNINLKSIFCSHCTNVWHKKYLYWVNQCTLKAERSKFTNIHKSIIIN